MMRRREEATVSNDTFCVLARHTFLFATSSFLGRDLINVN
jgi:hypothetical protein